MQKRRLKKITCAVAASLMGLSMPAAGVIGIGSPLIQSVSAADPETHTVKQGTKEGFMYTYSTIDKTKKGSIQIYKYEENNGVMAEGTGFKDDSATKTKDGQARRPISGVQFKGLKIADVVSVPGNDTVGTYYTNLNPIFTDLLKEYGLAQVPKAKVFTGDDADKSGKYYTTSSIEDALKQLNQSPVPSSEGGADNEKGGRKGTENKLSGVQAVNDAVNDANGAIQFAYTNKDGYTKKDNLDLGLYLIAETDYRPAAILNSEYKTADTDPSGAKYSSNGENVTGDTSQNHQDVETSTAPYLVSVPMTNVAKFTDDNQNTVDAGTVWFYDITTYPKNQTYNVTKKIIDPDTKDDKALEDYEDYSIGDTVKQTIYADAPANMKLGEVDTDNNDTKKTVRAAQDPNRYTVYSISDEMKPGLQFDGVTRVCYGAKIDPKKEQDFKDFTDLKEGVDYRVIETPVDTNPMVYKSFDEIENLMDKNIADAKPASDTKFCVQLTSEGIKKLNALDTDSQVVVFFDTQVTPKAKIGTDPQNTNQAKVRVKHEWTSTTEKYSNETRVYTYEINAKKTVEEAVDGGKLPDDFHPEKTSFTVKQTKHEGDGWASKDRTREDTKNIQLTNTVKTGTGDNALDTDWDDTDFVKFVQEEAGVYHVYAYKTDKEADATTIIRPAPDGKLIMKGLDAAKYTVTERGTQDHYGLQKASFDIDLTAATQTDAADYRSPKALERLAKNAKADEHVNGEIKTAKVTSDGTTSNLSLNSENRGIANVIIVNDKVVTLRTGGNGVIGIYVAAAGIGAAAVAAYVMKRRKTKANRNATAR